VPIILVVGLLAWASLRSVPVKANFAEQFDIFGASGDLTGRKLIPARR